MSQDLHSERLDLGRINHRNAWEVGEVTHIEREDGPNGMDLHRGADMLEEFIFGRIGP